MKNIREVMGNREEEKKMEEYVHMKKKFEEVEEVIERKIE